MARLKSPNSNRSFGGLALSEGEEAKLKRVLKDRGISLNYLSRYLIKKWLSDPTPKSTL